MPINIREHSFQISYVPSEFVQIHFYVVSCKLFIWKEAKGLFVCIGLQRNWIHEKSCSNFLDFPRNWITRLMGGYSFPIFHWFCFHCKGCYLIIIFCIFTLGLLLTVWHEFLCIKFLCILCKQTGLKRNE